MIEFPSSGLVRLPQILGDFTTDPPIPAFIPVSKSTWWAGVKTGRFPKPVKISSRVTCWRAEEIRALAEKGFCNGGVDNDAS